MSCLLPEGVIVLGQQLLLIEQGLQALMKFALENLRQIPDQFLEIGQLASRPLQVLLAGRQLGLCDIQLQGRLPQLTSQTVVQRL